MKKFAIAAAVIAFLNACSIPEGKVVSSDAINLSPDIASALQDYLKRERKPLAFAIADDGTSAYSAYYCEDERCAVDASVMQQALDSCDEVSGGAPCRIHAIRSRIVWKETYLPVRGEAQTPDLPRFEAVRPITRPLITELEEYQRELARRTDATVVNVASPLNVGGAIAAAPFPGTERIDRETIVPFFATNRTPESAAISSAVWAIEICQRRLNRMRKCKLVVSQDVIPGNGMALDRFIINARVVRENGAAKSLVITPNGEALD